MFKVLLYITIPFLLSCGAPEDTMPNKQPAPNMKDEDSTQTSSNTTLKYLALGDSYTIGQSVEENQRWPVLLVDSLKKSGLEFKPPDIIAQTGWTTDELMTAIENEQPDADYDLVSLLIGVNNQYRGYPFQQFEEEFEVLLKKAIELAGDDEENVIVLSIPDYGVTPFAEGSDQEKIAEEIDAYNAYKKKLCEQYDIVFFNITDISRKAKSDPSLIADDGLHPSGKMYQVWVEEIVEEVEEKF